MIIGYGKITRKEVRKEIKVKHEPVKGGSRIEFQSAGYKHGNFATINVKGKMLIARNQSARGLNVAALEPFKHELILLDQYDTHGDTAASARFVKDFKRLPEGSVVIIGAKDSATRTLSGQARNIIAEMGSQ